MTTVLLLTTGIILGACAGAFLTAVIMSGRDEPYIEPSDDDSALLDFLEQSECNLYFHPQVGAWGLLDGKDKMVATATTVRSTLERAMEKEAAELSGVVPGTPPDAAAAVSTDRPRSGGPAPSAGAMEREMEKDEVTA